jgi:hypothetical protein
VLTTKVRAKCAPATRGRAVDSRPGRFAAAETTATRTLCLSGAGKRALSSTARVALLSTSCLLPTWPAIAGQWSSQAGSQISDRISHYRSVAAQWSSHKTEELADLRSQIPLSPSPLAMRYARGTGEHRVADCRL